MKKSPKSDIELYVINRVKEMRVAHQLSQEDLALFLDIHRSFIGLVESRCNPEKYNLNHLNILAKELGCSPKDFLPDEPILSTSKKKKVNRN
jgi:transcriptional regulator with XRE-family HTH domain